MIITEKSLLKEAKKALQQNQLDDVIYLCDKVIEDFDPNSYFAYMYKGKALSNMRQTGDAIKCFIKATKINPDDPLCWKGLVSITKFESDYIHFFGDLLGLATVLEKSHNNLTPVVSVLREYKKKFNNNDEGFNLAYLKNTIPGLSELGDLIGEMMGNPSISLDIYISLISKKEKSVMDKELRKAKMSMPRRPSEKDKNKIDAIAWKHYATSEVPELYERLINTENDDSRRRKYEETYLKYKYELLKVAPKEQKTELSEEVFNMASDMVFVKNPSQFAWDLYLNWLDPEQLSDLDLGIITDYIKAFGSVGLGGILYTFISSENSPYELKQVINYMKIEKSKENKSVSPKEEKKPEIRLLQQVEDEALEMDGTQDDIDFDNIVAEELERMSADQASDMMIQSIQECKDSLLANRIVIDFFVHLKEYATALDYSIYQFSLLSKDTKFTTRKFSNARKEAALSLAIIYTYHEAPKNFPKALKFYDTVLQVDKTNVKAKIGKGLILMEKSEFKQAEKLLRGVVEEYPENYEALQEFGWCGVHLGKYDQGRDNLKTAYSKVLGTALSSFEIRSLILWRIAESYLMQLENDQVGESEATENIKVSFDNLIASLKQSSSNAPAYSSLGKLYLNYYDNKDRALKCFYKAFELDAGEVLASRELVKDFSEKGDWEMVEIVCSRVIESDKAKRYLSTEAEDNSWPYRMLACSALEKQDDAKAIEHFQNALRRNPSDLESWIGLGESYLARGRFEASLRVFTHALELDPDSWQAAYLLAVVQSAMGEYQESIQILKKLLNGTRSNEVCVITTLFETLVAKLESEVEGGFIGRSYETAELALTIFKQGAQLQPNSSKLWKSLCDLLTIVLGVGSHTSKITLSVLADILRFSPEPTSQEELLTEIITVDPSLKYNLAELRDHKKFKEILCYYLLRFGTIGVSCLPARSSKPMRASVIYNLGACYLEVFRLLDVPEFRDCSLKILKKAIQLESSNAEFWVALGNASLTKNVRVSQHCFIKASSLAPKEGAIWTNLAVLYLNCGDLELAKQCFIRGQSISPGSSTAWAGQALLADASGDVSQADHLYTHSYIISRGSKPLTMLMYGMSIVRKVIGKNFDESDLEISQQLNVATFAMLNYLKYSPNDQLALSFGLLLIERVRNFEIGIELSTQLCSLLESKYEETEDETTLVHFALAKSQLARLCLGIENYEDAIEAAKLSVDILGETDGLTENIQRCILSSLAVTGLSLYFKSNFEDSLVEFKKVLEISPDAKRIVVLIAQILYAYDEAETKQAAIEELFQNIEDYGSSLVIALTLASISIVEDLEDYLPAIKEELKSLPIESVVQDKNHSVPFLLDQINKRLGPGEEGKVWQRHAFLFPGECDIWKNLSGRMSKSVTLNSSKVDAVKVSNAYISSGNLREIQRGLFLHPGNRKGFLALRDCL